MRYRNLRLPVIRLLVPIFLLGVILSVGCAPISEEETVTETSTNRLDDTSAIPPTTTSTTAPTTTTTVATTSKPEETTTSTPVQTTSSPPAPEVDRSAAYIYEANRELTSVNYDSPALLPPSDDMGMDYIDRITFICDSPTYWMWPHGLFSDGADSKQIWTGPEGTMTLAYQDSYEILDPYDKVERPIRDVVALHPPDILIIALGINGVSFMNETYFTDEYVDLVTDIQDISPDTIIILQSIYPITHKYKHYGNITNPMITEANSWIMGIAEELGLPYLDTISVLLNDEGNAKDELLLADGLHPNRDGLILILDYIRTHAYVGDD